MEIARTFFGFLFLILFASVPNSIANSLNSETPTQEPYYGAAFYNTVLGSFKDEKLKLEIKNILKAGHIEKAGHPDEIVPNCSGLNNCFTQTSLSYESARKFLFGKFYLVKIDSSNYGINEKYCDRVYQNEDFKTGSKPGPDVVPDNAIINVEHTWPQSKFSGRYPKSLQKSDLHHLYPTDSQMNSTRGHVIFGRVDSEGQHTKCAASKIGVGSAGGVTIFEPPNNHKGHVARSLFYFSLRYDMPITAAEEVVLKIWNKSFPVDQEEKSRNDEIFKIQKNRNPFIDHPEMTNDISDF